MRLNKRGSIEIGINTIVIMVIAMMLLGLGVMFVKGIFNKLNDVPGKISLPDLNTPPSYSQPFVMDSDTVSVKRGDKATVDMGIYNTESSSAYFTVTIADDGCLGPGGSTDQVPIINILPQSIDAGKSGAFQAYINGLYWGENPEKEVPMTIGDYICNIQVYKADNMEDATKFNGQNRNIPSSETPTSSIQMKLTISG